MQKAETAYILSKQLLYFDFTEQKSEAANFSSLFKSYGCTENLTAVRSQNAVSTVAK